MDAIDPAAGQAALLLEAAVRIGDQLCDAAILDETGRFANWLGRRDIVEDAMTARFSVRTGAAGPEVYAGSAGIALFLAGLHDATGDPRYADIAAAALRRSVRYLQATTLPLHPFSFFAGHCGVLAVLRRLDRALPEEAAWLRTTIAAAGPPAMLDIIAGAAGGILALLDCARGEEEAAFIALARQCGDLLCGTAVWEEGACSWRVDPGADGKIAPALAGLAHGGTGMALALFALDRASSDPAFLETARGALAFTDRLYNEAEGAWLDTRSPHEPGAGSAKGVFQSGWCHGSAGIMLVRRFAASVDTERADEHRHYSAAGARSAAAAMRARLPEVHRDVSLCHGLLGHNEALADHARATGDAALERECLAVAATLARRHARIEDWPSGVNAGGPNPSLMIGAAGIGFHFLRLARPGVAPPLLTLFAE